MIDYVFSAKLVFYLHDRKFFYLSSYTDIS